MSWLATGPYPQFSAAPSTAASPSPSAQKQAAPAGKDKKPMPSSAPSSSAKGKAPVAAAAAAPAAAAAASSQDGTKQLQETILHMLEPREFLDTEQISKELSIDLQAATGAVSSLASKEMVITEVLERQEWVLTPEGKTIAEEGSHEAKVFYAVPAEGITQAELNAKLGESAKVGFGKALKSGWVSLKDGKITKATASVQDTAKEQLHGLLNDPSGAKIDKAVLADLKKRKLANNITIKSHKVTKGPQFATTITTLATDLDASMLASGSWKTQSYKAYNYNSLGLPTQGGQLHPLLKVREEFRNIFFEMGFTEMPTNNFVESSFWNFDTLFQPQQHPARDAHDTFFISDPEKATEFPEEYLQKVKTVHAEGGFGSLGYRYDWKLEEAQKNILRTHTTAVSARMLYKLAQEGEFHPVKYFSIDRVFRNEALDATHLAEFHQIEGLVADYDLSLSDLIGLLEAFFKKLGMTRLRFKPAYNPYTEPSMEIFAFHEGLGKWIEVGNSGVFRPEMLLPMGLPPSVSVIAWGVSLERPTMIKYAINNIRDLCGHKIDLHMVKKNPICRLDKN